jgi:hypothetical protein
MSGLDLAQPWIRLQDDDTTVVSSRELMQLALDLKQRNIVGSFLEMEGRKIFRIPTEDGLFIVFIQTRPTDDLDNVDLYSLMGGK